MKKIMSTQPTPLDDRLRKILLVQPKESRASAIELTIVQIKEAFADYIQRGRAELGRTASLGGKKGAIIHVKQLVDEGWTAAQIGEWCDKRLATIETYGEADNE